MDHDKLLRILGPALERGAKVYLVGGAVRDGVAGLPFRDADLVVTRLPIDDLVEALEKVGSVDLVGKSFGVIKFHPTADPENEIDVALPRRERSTGEGHRDFEVDFDPSLPIEADLARRDFTFNAIAQDLETGEYIDPHGGVEDLRRRILRMVFPEAFEEDPLRMLRAVQLAARFGCRLSPETLSAIRRHAELIETISRERVLLEMHKLFERAERPSIGLRILAEGELLGRVFADLAAMPEVPAPPDASGSAWDYLAELVNVLSADFDLRLAGLFSELGRSRDRTADRSEAAARFRLLAPRDMRLPVLQTRRVAAVIASCDLRPGAFAGSASVRRALLEIPDGMRSELGRILELAEHRLELTHPGEVAEFLGLRRRFEEESKLEIYEIADLPVSGEDILARGFEPGPKVGDVLRQLQLEVIEDPRRKDREYLLSRLDEIVRKGS